MLGTLAHYDGDAVAYADLPELERVMLHKLAEVGAEVKEGYREYDFKAVFSSVLNFMNIELSAFYFDVRKDALYCDPKSSLKRRAALHVVALLYDHLVKWLAPLIPFTAEEAWLERHPGDTSSVHLELFPTVPGEWTDAALDEKWEKVKRVRRVVTGALEIERREKRIGSSLEAAPMVHVEDKHLLAALDGLDFAEICITSQIAVTDAPAPDGAFRLEDGTPVAVVPKLAEGRKCARSWKILPEVGSDPDYPDVTLRDAQALRELAAEA